MKKFKFIKVINGYKFVFKEIKNAGITIFLLSFFAVLISGSASVFTSYILKNIISITENILKIQSETPYIYLFSFILIYTAFNIFRSTLHRFNMTANRILGMHLSQNIKEKIVKKIENVSHKFFYNPEFQNEYTSVLSSSQSEPMQLITSTFYSVANIIQIFEIFIILVKCNSMALLILSTFLLFNVVIQFKIQSKYVNIWSLQSESMRKNSYYFGVMTQKETLKEMQVFNMYGYFIKKMRSAFADNISIWKKFGKKEIIQNLLGQMLSCIGIVISIFYLIISSIKRQSPIADVVFYLNLMFSFQSVCNSLTDEVSVGYKGILFIDKLLNFLNKDFSIKSGNVTLKSKQNHILEFRNVSFKYPGNNEYSLKNVNFKIKSGENVCLVGLNGCGKSTLINLILRLYDPTEGNIYFDRVDIKKFNIKGYRSNIAPIFQEYQRYSIPVKDYISLGDVSKNENLFEIKEAARLSNSFDFIDNLPEGFNTMLTKKFDFSGIELSGGQWQRLAISRVFFSKAPILIFDEPTSSLDVISEKEVFKKICKVRNKLVILVTHRISYAKYADKIVFMDKGKILNSGTHLELLRNCKGYRAMLKAEG